MSNIFLIIDDTHIISDFKLILCSKQLLEESIKYKTLSFLFDFHPNRSIP